MLPDGPVLLTGQFAANRRARRAGQAGAECATIPGAMARLFAGRDQWKVRIASLLETTLPEASIE